MITCLFSQRIINIVFGAAYISSGKFLVLYSVVGLLYYAYCPLMQLLIIKNDQLYSTVTFLELYLILLA